MKVFILVLLFIVGTSPLLAGKKHPDDYLKHRIYASDKRYPTFLRALQLMKERKCATIVETGTSRSGAKNFQGDGGSTIIFGEWAHRHKAQFYSVDINLDSLHRAEKALNKELDERTSFVHFINGDSVAFLTDFPYPIDFLYLDSYDFDESNPLPSQTHHLREIEAAYPHLTERSVVMIDDCALAHGGKGKFVIDYLVQRGWTVLENRYQVILVR